MFSFSIILGIHLLFCVTLIGLVLVQQGKGADAGATFGGGGGSNTMFGAAGAGSFLTKLTTGLAIAFMCTSILLVRAYSNAPGVIPGAGSEANPLQGGVFETLKEAEVASETAVEESATVADETSNTQEIPADDVAVEETGAAASEIAEGPEAVVDDAAAEVEEGTETQ